MENVQINIVKFIMDQGENGYIPFRSAIEVNPNETIEQIVKRCLTHMNGNELRVHDAVIEIRAVKSETP